MAIERVSTLLKMADEANTSVIGFNCIDYNTVYAVCHAVTCLSPRSVAAVSLMF